MNHLDTYQDSWMLIPVLLLLGFGLYAAWILFLNDIDRSRFEGDDDDEPPPRSVADDDGEDEESLDGEVQEQMVPAASAAGRGTELRNVP